MKNNNLHIGVIGAGGFALFAADAFSSIAGVKITAVYDVNKNAATQFAEAFQAHVFDNYDTLLQHKNVDLVYIATPPFLHYEQSRQALLAGKHVICEKPAALKWAEAEDLQALEKSHQLLYVVNLMQRYNPLYHIVKQIIDQKILGAFLHGYFENYASDENLRPDHWFWNEAKSGGIFIEHGVHFFDMFSGWFGKGEVLNAIQLQRPGVEAKLVDRVQATVLYSDAIVNFYHGFDQPKILDRQELRLQFEKGDITLYEWVPVKMQLHGILKKENIDFLKEFAGDLVIRKLGTDKPNQIVKGRFKSISYDEQVLVEAGNRADKQNRYKEILIAMLSDQWNWIKDPDHKRIISADNAVESLRLAEQASQIVRYIDARKNLIM